MPALNKIQKLSKLLTIALVFAASLNAQSTFAEEHINTENGGFVQLQPALIDWNQQARITLTSRLDEKLQKQLVAEIVKQNPAQLAKNEETIYQNSNLLLAENNI